MNDKKSKKEKVIEIGAIASLSTAPMIAPHALLIKHRKDLKRVDKRNWFSSTKRYRDRFKKRQKDMPFISKLQRNMGTSERVHVNTPGGIKGGGGSFAYTDFDIDGKKMKKGVHYLKKGLRGVSDFEKGIISHELGHASNIKFLKKNKLFKPYIKLRGLAGISLAANILSSAGLGNSKEENNISKGVAIASSIPLGVQLAEEMVATAKGVKGLQKTYGGGTKGLRKALMRGKGGGLRSSIMNLLTYGTMAATPLISQLVRKKVIGKKDEK